MRIQAKLIVVLAALAVACGGSSKKNGGALTAQIVEPNGTSTILKSTAVRLRATFKQGNADITPSKVTWKSSIATDVVPQTNPADNVVFTDSGSRDITVTGTYGSLTGQASVTLNVGDIGVQIVRPTNDRQVAPGATVTLQGAAQTWSGTNQINLNPTTATFAWTADGTAFGTNVTQLPSPNTLPVGDHTIALTVSYLDATTNTTLTGTASIVLKVNTPPQVSITAPSCPISLESGATQVFAGVANDAEDGPLTGDWLDLLTNASSNGDNWTFSSTVVGKHELSFSATDSSGATATATCGVMVYPTGGNAGSLFPSAATVNSALPSTSVDTVTFDGGNLVVGTRGQVGFFDGSLALINDGTPPTDPYDGNALGFGAGTVSVHEVAFSGGKALAATGLGLSECTDTNGNLSACTASEIGRQFVAVAVSGDLSATAVVAAASPDGLYLATYSGGTATSHFYNASVLTTQDNLNDVLFIAGALYVATDSGVCVINNPAAAVSTTASTLCDSVIDVRNASSLAVSGNTLWIGSDAGLTSVTIGSTATLTLTTDDGLPSNAVSDVVVGADGIVWVATDNGVGRLDPSTGNIVTIRPPDYNGSAQVRSIAIAPDGSKWFGTQQGVVHYTGA